MCESNNFSSIAKKYKLKKLASNKKREKGVISHTFYGPPYGSYYVPHDCSDEFNAAYEKARLAGNKLHVIERPKNISPLCIDVDLRFKDVYNKREYNIKHVKCIISYVNEIINKYVAIDEKKILAFVTEKPKPSKDIKNKEYKDGFHIMYPFIPLTKKMRYIITDMITTEMGKNKTFNEIPFCNQISDVIDTSVVYNNGWLMYGSCKYKGQTYKLTKIYSFNVKSIKLEKYTKNISCILSTRKFTEEDEVPLRASTQSEDFKRRSKSIMDKYENTSKKNMKKMLNKNKFIQLSNDVSKNYNIDEMVNDDDNHNDVFIDEESDGEDDIVRPKASKEDILLAKKMVKILSDDRANTYLPWIYLGWCLKNISDTLLDCWIQFSERWSGYKNDSECRKIWNESFHGNMGIGTLCYWAKTDNITDYCKIMRDKVKEIIMKAESGTHYDIARVIKALYYNQFRCSSIKHKTWYEFQGHRWVNIDSANTLNTLISEKITQEFCYLNQYYSSSKVTNTREYIDIFNTKSKKIMKIINDLKNTSFKNSVIDQCAHLFYEKDFEEKLDENRDLIGFNNGIYDLKAGYFRDGTPDDYVTFTVKYEYREFSMRHTYIKHIIEFFRKIQPDPDMHKYLLTLLASHLDGHNKGNRFIIFTGESGSNGKSTCLEFMQLVMGDYASTAAPTLITRKPKGAGDATPEIADKRGVRLIQMDEPQRGEQIYASTMKRYSGNDKLPARALFGDPFYYYPQFKLIMLCNKKPPIDDTDGGTWRRIRVTSWDSRFIDLDEEIEDPKHEFYKDPDIGDKMKKWKRAFMWLLLHKYYKYYRNNKGYVKEPTKVKQWSDDYQKQSDIYFEYINDNLEITRNKQDFEKLQEIYDGFKYWFKQNYNGNPVPKKNEFDNYLDNNKKLKIVIRKKRVYGVKFKNDDDDDIIPDDIEIDQL
jgi:P4 family phage/plasmid primase-like protien